MAQAALRARPQQSTQAKKPAQIKKMVPASRPALRSIQRTKRRPSLGKRLGMLFIATVLLSQVVLFAYAQHAGLISEVVKFPCRVISSVVNGAVGGVNGGFQGIVEAEQQMAYQTFGQAENNLMMIPAGIVGIAIAIPVGFITGAPDDIMRSGSEGYLWWDTMGQG